MAECDRFQEFRSGVPAATEDARRQAAARLRSAMEGKDRRGREPDSQSAGGPDGLCLPSPRLPQRLVPRSSSAPRGRTRLRSSSERRQPHTTRRDHPAPEVGVEVDLGGPGVHGHPRGPRSASIPHPTVPYPDAQTNRPTRMSTPKPSIRLRPADWAASSQPAARRATADGQFASSRSSTCLAPLPPSPWQTSRRSTRTRRGKRRPRGPCPTAPRVDQRCRESS